MIAVIYDVTSRFPDEERFGLISQMRRAAVSIPSNIAEGMGRGSAKELIRFLLIARGSLHEIRSQLETVRLLSFLSKEDFDKLMIRYTGLDAGINSHLETLSKYK